jgi:hypothetical protein
MKTTSILILLLSMRASQESGTRLGQEGWSLEVSNGMKVERRRAKGSRGDGLQGRLTPRFYTPPSRPAPTTPSPPFVDSVGVAYLMVKPASMRLLPAPPPARAASPYPTSAWRHAGPGGRRCRRRVLLVVPWKDATELLGGDPGVRSGEPWNGSIELLGSNGSGVSDYSCWGFRR